MLSSAKAKTEAIRTASEAINVLKEIEAAIKAGKFKDAYSRLDRESEKPRDTLVFSLISMADTLSKGTAINGLANQLETLEMWATERDDESLQFLDTDTISVNAFGQMPMIEVAQVLDASNTGPARTLECLGKIGR